jgi:hypothetical protein
MSVNRHQRRRHPSKVLGQKTNPHIFECDVLLNKMKVVGLLTYLILMAIVSWACFSHPVSDDFDRYIYEALIRQKHEPIEDVYASIKHSYKRAEESTILDSPGHLAELEPMYAIKPVYLEIVDATRFTGLPIQSRINIVSAISLFGVGLLALAWTKSPLYSLLLITSSPVIVLGRMGTPDSLSTLVVLMGIWAIVKRHLLSGLIILLVSIWVRTDNVLLLVGIIAFLLVQRKITSVDAGVFAVLSVACVFFINHFSGNYGWRVLFQFSFIGGRWPGEIVPHFGFMQYLHIVGANAQTILPQLSIWIILAMVSWRWRSPNRNLLIPIWLAVVTHFVLYPSAEARYLVWAFVATGMVFVSAVWARKMFEESVVEGVASVSE